MPVDNFFWRNCSDPVSRLIDISFVVAVAAVVVFVLYLKIFHMSWQKVQEQLLMRETLIVGIHEWKKWIFWQFKARLLLPFNNAFFNIEWSNQDELFEKEP